MSDLVVDASLTLQWFLTDETNRQYSLKVLSTLAENRAVVPALWSYEVGNGLVMAYRRKRVTVEQIKQFVAKLDRLPIVAMPVSNTNLSELPELALAHQLTNYDAAYLDLARRMNIALATSDVALARAASSLGVAIF